MIWALIFVRSHNKNKNKSKSKTRRKMNYIKYKNQDLPVKFSYRVLKEIKGKYNVDLTVSNEELQNWISDTSNQEILFFLMLKEGHRQANVELLYKQEDIEDIFCEQNAYADFLLAYQKDAIEFITPSKKDSVEKKTI